MRDPQLDKSFKYCRLGSYLIKIRPYVHLSDDFPSLERDVLAFRPIGRRYRPSDLDRDKLAADFLAAPVNVVLETVYIGNVPVNVTMAAAVTPPPQFTKEELDAWCPESQRKSPRRWQEPPTSPTHGCPSNCCRGYKRRSESQDGDSDVENAAKRMRHTTPDRHSPLQALAQAASDLPPVTGATEAAPVAAINNAIEENPFAFSAPPPSAGRAVWDLVPRQLSRMNLDYILHAEHPRAIYPLRNSRSASSSPPRTLEPLVLGSPTEIATPNLLSPFEPSSPLFDRAMTEPLRSPVPRDVPRTSMVTYGQYWEFPRVPFPRQEDEAIETGSITSATEELGSEHSELPARQAAPEPAPFPVLQPGVAFYTSHPNALSLDTTAEQRDSLVGPDSPTTTRNERHYNPYSRQYQPVRRAPSGPVVLVPFVIPRRPTPPFALARQVPESPLSLRARAPVTPLFASNIHTSPLPLYAPRPSPPQIDTFRGPHVTEPAVAPHALQSVARDARILSAINGLMATYETHERKWAKAEEALSGALSLVNEVVARIYVEREQRQAEIEAAIDCVYAALR